MKTENTLISSARWSTGNPDIVQAQKDKNAAGEKPMVQPLIRTHPGTGRKAIYLGMPTSHIEGLDEEASSLADLQEFIDRPISLQVDTHYQQPQYDIAFT